MVRLRFLYRVCGPLRYVSHLEQMKVWERAMRRAGLPLAYTGGFTPRPRLQVAAPLPVGFASEGELMDAWMEQPVAPEEVLKALTRTLPEGLEILEVREADLGEPSLPVQVEAAEYEVRVETAVPEGELRKRLEELLSSTALPRERRGRSYDLRPLIRALNLEDASDGWATLRMTLSLGERATGRPEEVVDALGLGGAFFQVTRRRLLLKG
ncbi:MAG: TIGR03936 family radical SAM-associated protein [Anaerolineae bacterium]|nr:TIGR03936 family radical SAM-associated protein [Anaerolineae bacterium]MCX8068551.1 TIGR03936 family radical SAM-associated protein [Anaerolineae bacterium]